MHHADRNAHHFLIQSVRTPPAFPMMRPSDFAMERARKAIARRRIRATLNAAACVAAVFVTGIHFV